MKFLLLVEFGLLYFLLMPGLNSDTTSYPEVRRLHLYKGTSHIIAQPSFKKVGSDGI